MARAASKVRRTARTGSEKGQSLVEMAVAFPILLLILAAVIDAGRAIDAYITITNAVREGARYGAKYPSRIETIRLRVANEANGSGVNVTGVNLTVNHVSVTFPEGSNRGGNPVRVTVDFDFPLYFGGIVGLPSLHLQRYADMVIMTGP
ncbi:MAG: pilus assembly protein [Chloroflexi bacterium]|nr:pilus assembly protein [Chloroflexota bacterium]